jgi:Uncharacterized protein conserved in bacteria (DUF2066)
MAQTGPGAGAGGGLYAVARVAVDATAKDAATARGQALLDGQRRALATLTERLTLAGDRDRLPAVNDAALAAMVQGIEIADERTSATRYIARVNVRFKPDAIRQYLRDAGVPYSETVSKPLLVIPVFEHEGVRSLWDGSNPWRTAWAARERSFGLMRIILPLGDLADSIVMDVDRALTGDTGAIAALTQRYGLTDAMVAYAGLQGDQAVDEPRVQVTLLRLRPDGRETLTEVYAGGSFADVPGVMNQVVDFIANRLEEEWKQATLLRPESGSTLDVTVPLANIDEWLAVRERLESMAELRQVEVLALNRGGARVVLHYFGDPTRLKVALAQRDLELAERGGSWTLRSLGPSSARPNR